MTPVSVILKRYANSRLNALKAVKRCDMGRVKAATKIKNVADYFSGKPHSVQIRGIRQIESEIRLLLPPQGSRFEKQRISILQLLDQANHQ